MRIGDWRADLLAARSKLKLIWALTRQAQADRAPVCEPEVERVREAWSLTHVPMTSAAMLAMLAIVIRGVAKCSGGSDGNHVQSQLRKCGSAD